MTYARHPLSSAFPDMPESDFGELIDDIAAHGLRHPVVLYQGQVLDGWHRFQACIKAAVKPLFTTYNGTDPAAYVVSQNLMRRNLTASQRGLAEVAVNEWVSRGRPEKPAPGAGFSAEESAPAPKTESDMAREAGVSERTIRQAKAVQTNGASVLKEAVKEGQVSLKTADAIAKLPKAEQRAAVKAAAEPAKPKPKGDSAPARADPRLSEKFGKLSVENQELRDALDASEEKRHVLADELKTLEAHRDGVQVVEMDKLREEIRVLTVRLHDLTNRCDEKQNQINYWKKKAGVPA